MATTRSTDKAPPANAPVTGPRLQIDWTLCEARGHCAELLPELLVEDPWGYPAPRRGNLTRGMAVPPHLLQHARDAAISCPRLAIILHEK